MPFQTVLWLIISTTLASAGFLLRNSHFIMSISKSIKQRRFNTIVKVSTSYRKKCSDSSDEDDTTVSLTDYMRLPVDQYVCIKMPLDATLSRIDASLFKLSVPPVNFFHIQVSPTVYANVTQNSSAVIIESNKCLLDGSSYVKSLNGCYNFFIRTVFRWEDSVDEYILSSTNLYVEVDPPFPFDRIPRPVLEKTGAIAMSTAIKIIEQEFVKGLSLDYRMWSRDELYRNARAKNGDRQECDIIVKN